MHFFKTNRPFALFGIIIPIIIIIYLFVGLKEALKSARIQRELKDQFKIGNFWQNLLFSQNEFNLNAITLRLFAKKMSHFSF